MDGESQDGREFRSRRIGRRAVSAGDMRDKTSLIGCTTSGGYIKASKKRKGPGGLVGVVDLYGMIAMDSCVNTSTPVSGSYGVGGLLGVGSLYSPILPATMRESRIRELGLYGSRGLGGFCRFPVYPRVRKYG